MGRRRSQGEPGSLVQSLVMLTVVIAAPCGGLLLAGHLATIPYTIVPDR